MLSVVSSKIKVQRLSVFLSKATHCGPPHLPTLFLTFHYYSDQENSNYKLLMIALLLGILVLTAISRSAIEFLCPWLFFLWIFFGGTSSCPEPHRIPSPAMQFIMSISSYRERGRDQEDTGAWQLTNAEKWAVNFPGGNNEGTDSSIPGGKL